MNRGIKDLQSSALPLGYVAEMMRSPHRINNNIKLPCARQEGKYWVGNSNFTASLASTSPAPWTLGG